MTFPRDRKRCIIQGGKYLEKNRFNLLDDEGNKVGYKGAWILVDGGYLNWSTLICPYKEAASLQEQR